MLEGMNLKRHSSNTGTQFARSVVDGIGSRFWKSRYKLCPKEIVSYAYKGLSFFLPRSSYSTPISLLLYSTAMQTFRTYC